MNPENHKKPSDDALTPYTIRFSVLGSVIYEGDDEDDVKRQIVTDWRENLDCFHFDELESMTVEQGEYPLEPSSKRRRQKPNLHDAELPITFMIYFRAHGVIVMEGKSKEEVTQVFGAEWKSLLDLDSFEHIERLEVVRVVPYQE